MWLAMNKSRFGYTHSFNSILFCRRQQIVWPRGSSLSEKFFNPHKQKLRLQSLTWCRALKSILSNHDMEMCNSMDGNLIVFLTAHPGMTSTSRTSVTRPWRGIDDDDDDVVLMATTHFLKICRFCCYSILFWSVVGWLRIHHHEQQ